LCDTANDPLEMTLWVRSDVFDPIGQCRLLPRKRPEKPTWYSLEEEHPRTPHACPLLWSLSGDKRTLHDHRKSVGFDP